MQVSHIPLRVATGAFILNSGLSKQGLEGQAAEGLHDMAVGAWPSLGALEPRRFAQVLSTAEVALGAALLVPVVPSAVVGTALVGFSAGLVQLYLKTPGMRQPGSVRPTQEGIGLAKDVWLLGAGLTLVLGSRRKRRSGPSCRTVTMGFTTATLGPAVIGSPAATRGSNAGC
jgi:hypothetical protein